MFAYLHASASALHSRINPTHALPEWLHTLGCCGILLAFIIAILVAVLSRNEKRAKTASQVAKVMVALVIVILIK